MADESESADVAEDVAPPAPDTEIVEDVAPKKELTQGEKIDLIVSLLKANGWSLPEELSEA